MSSVYQDCAGEAGTGMFMRMKDRMSVHVAQEKSQMFQSATAAVSESLLKLCDTVRKALLAQADEVYVSMHRDYLTIIGGMNVGLVRISAEERGVRRDVDRLIEETDTWFGEVLAADLAQLEGRAADEEHPEDVPSNEDREEFDDADESIFIDSETEDEDENGDDAGGDAAVDGEDIERSPKRENSLEL
jgi:hypothetical protein